MQNEIMKLVNEISCVTVFWIQHASRQVSVWVSGGCWRERHDKCLGTQSK